MLEDAYNEFLPDLTKLVVQSYADIAARDNLDKRYRQIATVALKEVLSERN